MVTQDILPLDKAALKEMSAPQVTGQPESIPYSFYSFESYPAATGIAKLTFFTQGQGDLRRTNMKQSGMLPADQWFRVYNVCLAVMAGPTISNTATTAGAITDLAAMLKVSRPFAQFTLNNKEYITAPLALFHDIGGPLGLVSSTMAASNIFEYAQNGPPDGSWDFRGGIIIPPLTPFEWTANWPTLQTLATLPDTFLGIVMVGNLHRNIQ